MMRRSSKRGVTPTAATAGLSSSRSTAKDTEKIVALFSKYAEKNDDTVIGPEGVETLCKDLGTSPADIKILLLAWKFHAERMGFFSLEEWQRGLRAMRVDSIDKLKAALPALQQEVANPLIFRDFYAFAFRYCLTEPRQKTLDLETASQMLQLVVGTQTHTPGFLQFLQEQSEYKVLNLDQWIGFLRFCEEVKLDLSNYDENMAWPLILDNYVDWVRQKGKG